jgi:hypothetical protein
MPWRSLSETKVVIYDCTMSHDRQRDAGHDTIIDGMQADGFRAAVKTFPGKAKP